MEIDDYRFESTNGKWVKDYGLELDAKKRTATEVMKMEGEKAALLGAVVGNTESEVLDPSINRTFRIEYEAGRLPPIPEELVAYGVALCS